MPQIMLVEDNQLNRDKCIAAGCDDYDIKPVDFKRLPGKIQTLLGS